jgi:hypothetical protein
LVAVVGDAGMGEEQRGKFVWNGFSVRGGGVDDALW